MFVLKITCSKGLKQANRPLRGTLKMNVYHLTTCHVWIKHLYNTIYILHIILQLCDSAGKGAVSVSSLVGAGCVMKPTHSKVGCTRNRFIAELLRGFAHGKSTTDYSSSHVDGFLQISSPHGGNFMCINCPVVWIIKSAACQFLFLI